MQQPGSPAVAGAGGRGFTAPQEQQQLHQQPGSFQQQQQQQQQMVPGFGLQGGPPGNRPGLQQLARDIRLGMGPAAANRLRRPSRAGGDGQSVPAYRSPPSQEQQQQQPSSDSEGSGSTAKQGSSSSSSSSRSRSRRSKASGSSPTSSTEQH
jgi:hypothetical protein